MAKLGQAQGRRKVMDDLFNTSEVLDKVLTALGTTISGLESDLKQMKKGTKEYEATQKRINDLKEKEQKKQEEYNKKQGIINKAFGSNLDQIKFINDKAIQASEGMEVVANTFGDNGKDVSKAVTAYTDQVEGIVKAGGDVTEAQQSVLTEVGTMFDNVGKLGTDEFKKVDAMAIAKKREEIVKQGGTEKDLAIFDASAEAAQAASTTDDLMDDVVGKTMDFGKSIQDTIGKIPLVGGVLSGVMGEQLKIIGADLKKNLTTQLMSGKLSAAGIGKAFRGTIPAIRAMGSALMTATGGLTLLLGLLAAAAVALVGLAKKARDYATDQGIAFSQSVKLQGSIMAAKAKMIGLDMDAGKIAGEMIEAFGTLDRVNSGNIAQIGKLSRRFGVGTNDLITFQKAFTDVTGASVDVANDVVRAVGSMATGAGVAAGKVIADIAGNMEAFARFSQDGASGMAKAAIEAAKIGSSLGEVVKVADSLLNFEQSITSEFEAQVLTGKNLNLERARAAALQGDFATLTAEIQQQVGGLGNLQAMNVIQKDAIAGALGLSVSELTKIARGEATEDEDSPELKEQKRTNQILIDGFTGNKEALDNIGKKSSESSGGMFGDFL